MSVKADAMRRFVWVTCAILTACSNPWEPIQKVVDKGSRFVVVVPAKPGLFLVSPVHVPGNKPVTVIEKVGEQEVVVVYGADGKPVSVIEPLTKDQFQVLSDPDTLAQAQSHIDGLTRPLRAAEASSGEEGSHGGPGGKGRSAGPIKVGMTMDQVRAKVGPPDETYDHDGETVWITEPIQPVSDIASDTVTHATSQLPFMLGSLGYNAGHKAVPKKTTYQVTFSGGVVSDVSVFKH